MTPTPALQQRSFRVFVVLPAYNEEASLPGLLSKLDGYLTDDWLRYHIIAVDDGSSDRTPEVLEQFAERLPLSILSHRANLGLGSTIRDGLLAAAKSAGDDDIVITMDADETHTPGLILSMVRFIREGHDVVVASRYRPGSRVYGLRLHRRLISWAASILMRLIFPIRGVHDYTCGYRAYRGSVLKHAISHYGDRFFDQDGFQCMVDLLLKLRTLPLIFGEVPLILRYDLKKSNSKMKLLQTSVRTLHLLLIRRLGR